MRGMFEISVHKSAMILFTHQQWLHDIYQNYSNRIFSSITIYQYKLCFYFCTTLIFDHYYDNKWMNKFISTSICGRNK